MLSTTIDLAAFSWDLQLTKNRCTAFEMQCLGAFAQMQTAPTEYFKPQFNISLQCLFDAFVQDLLQLPHRISCERFTELFTECLSATCVMPVAPERKRPKPTAAQHRHSPIFLYLRQAHWTEVVAQANLRSHSCQEGSHMWKLTQRANNGLPCFA